MTTSQVIEPEAKPVPTWWADMVFCHIDDGSGLKAYCGAPDGDGPITCEVDWDGEAICPGCGNPVCPRCVQLSNLDDQLEET